MLKRVEIKKEERTVICPFCKKTINLDNLLGCGCIHICRDNPVTPRGGPYYELFNVWFQYPCWYQVMDVVEEA